MIPLLLALEAQAGAWTREAGSWYAKGGADTWFARGYDQPGVVTQDEDRYLGQSYGLYGETGVSKGHPVQLAASLPLSIGTLWFVRREGGARAEGRATVTRLGDLRLRPQVALLRDQPLALAIEAKLPLYRIDSVCDQDPAFQALCPHPGDGQVDLAPLLLGGVGGDAGFAELSVGWLHRTEIYVGRGDLALGDGVIAAVTGGVSAGPVLALAKADATLSPRDDGVTPQLVRAGPAVMVDVADGIAIEGRAQVDLWSRNAARGVGAGIGLSARR